jgi:hypothetical protein
MTTFSSFCRLGSAASGRYESESDPDLAPFSLGPTSPPSVAVYRTGMWSKPMRIARVQPRPIFMSLAVPIIALFLGIDGHSSIPPRYRFVAKTRGQTRVFDPREDEVWRSSLLSAREV